MRTKTSAFSRKMNGLPDARALDPRSATRGSAGRSAPAGRPPSRLRGRPRRAGARPRCTSTNEKRSDAVVARIASSRNALRLREEPPEREPDGDTSDDHDGELRDPRQDGECPVTIAALANFRSTRPVASFTRLSPSRTVTICRGRRTRRAIAVAATASGGDTIGPEDEGRGPRHAGHERHDDRRDGRGRRDDETDGEERDRDEVRAEVAPRGEVARRVEDRREEEQEDELRIERHGRQARHERDGHPPDDEKDRVRDLRLVREKREKRRQAEERENRLDGLHGTHSRL